MGNAATTSASVEAEAVTAVAEAEAATETGEAEEIAEAQVGATPAQGPEKPEVSRGCRCARNHICLPCPSGKKKTHHYGGGGPPDGPGSRYFQELAPVRTVLGGLK